MSTPIRPLRHLGRGLVVVLALALGLLSLQALAGPVTSSGFTSEGREIVRSAVARFEAAGLELPLTHLRQVSFGERCKPRGKAVDSWPVKFAQICVVDEEVVIHELAHSWAFVNLNGAERLDFAVRRGTPTWRSREHPWMDRASEHAADIITWYLYWSDSQEGGLTRIAGDVSAETYMSDLAWLMAAAEAPEATEILAARAAELAPMWVSTESQ